MTDKKSMHQELQELAKEHGVTYSDWEEVYKGEWETVTPTDDIRLNISHALMVYTCKHCGGAKGHREDVCSDCHLSKAPGE